jgi:molecular chaperone DnaJ
VKDYFQILQVDKSASETEIKQAYRKLAHKYHPDKNGDDKLSKELFQEISEAYDFLMVEENRRKLSGQSFSFRKAPTAAEILHEAQKIVKLVKASDPYRINHDSILYKMRELLRSSHLYILKNETDEMVKKQFLTTVIETIQLLNYDYYSEVINELRKLETGDDDYLDTLLKKKKNERLYRMGTYVLVILAAIFLCFMIWMIADNR